MSQLVCPLCSESLEEEGYHFLKHFKYKKYACGDNACYLEFYTEADRNTHCTKHGHKRSFQKTVNPYIDKMISMIVEDARQLATKDMDTVLENRWGSSQHSVAVMPDEKTKQKRSTSTAMQIPNENPLNNSNKKTRLSAPTTSSEGAGEGIVRKTSNKPSLATSETRNTNILFQKPAFPQPVLVSNPIHAVVDSTTNDRNAPIEKLPRKSQKKTSNSASGAAKQRKPPLNLPNPTYEEMPAIDRITGWFDPNVTDRQDALKIKCYVCNEEIIYDFILRKGHVTRCHMAADIHPNDYEDLLKAAMDRSYPDFPNSDMACQLCMTNQDVRKTSRREHIENYHVTSIPPLICPIGDCNKGYRRQCELSAHMKEAHKTSMCLLKNSEFQQIRRRRNAMINEMMNKCFPWSRMEAIENKVSVSTDKLDEAQRTQIDHNFDRDVRVKDANKTRRAPLYNSAASSSSSSDSENEGSTSTTADPSHSINLEDYAQDVIFIGHQFNTEVAKKLSERASSMIKIKPEIIDVEDVTVHDAPLVSETPLKQEVDEQAEDVNSVQPSNPSLLASYVPIVSPPATTPAETPIEPHSPRLPTRILSPSIPDDKQSGHRSSNSSREHIHDSNNRWLRSSTRRPYHNKKSNRSYHHVPSGSANRSFCHNSYNRCNTPQSSSSNRQNGNRYNEPSESPSTRRYNNSSHPTPYASNYLRSSCRDRDDGCSIRW